MERWHFGLNSSVIRDGTYTDLHRGQQLEFVVSLRLESWDPTPRSGGRSGPTSEPQVEAVRVEANRYDVVARIEAVGEGAWVLDCGLLAGCPGRPPAGLDVGRWIKARVVLDLSSHPSGLHAPDLPPLAHMWFVERVHYRTDSDQFGLLDLGLHGGPEEPGWEELAFTNAWQDDDGRAEYLVECLPVNA